MKFTKRPPDVAMKNAQFFRWIPPDLGPKWLQVWPSTVTLKDPEKGELDIVSDGGWRDLVVPCHQLWDVDPNQLKPCMCRKGKSIFDGLNGKIRSGILMEMIRQGTICDIPCTLLPFLKLTYRPKNRGWKIRFLWGCSACCANSPTAHVTSVTKPIPR